MCEGLQWEMLCLCRASLHPEQAPPVVYILALRNLLVKGQGKNNVKFVRPPNYAKTYLFKPLQTMLKAFSNNSGDKYAWIQKAEIIFLNDFRWKSGVIV